VRQHHPPQCSSRGRGLKQQGKRGAGCQGQQPSQRRQGVQGQLLLLLASRGSPRGRGRGRARAGAGAGRRGRHLQGHTGCLCTPSAPAGAANPPKKFAKPRSLQALPNGLCVLGGSSSSSSSSSSSRGNLSRELRRSLALRFCLPEARQGCAGRGS